MQQSTGLDQLSKDDKKRALESIKECEQGGGKELVLSGYGLSLLPNVVYDKFTPSLRIASLEFNAFGVFPDLSPFTLLTEVRLSGNQIVTLNMLKLMVCRLLVTLSNVIRLFQGNLRVLLLNGNRITAIGDEFEV